MCYQKSLYLPHKNVYFDLNSTCDLQICLTARCCKFIRCSDHANNWVVFCIFLSRIDRLIVWLQKFNSILFQFHSNSQRSQLNYVGSLYCIDWLILFDWQQTLLSHAVWYFYFDFLSVIHYHPPMKTIHDDAIVQNSNFAINSKQWEVSLDQ